MVVNVAGPHSLGGQPAGRDRGGDGGAHAAAAAGGRLGAGAGRGRFRAARPLICADGDVGCYWRSDTGNKLLIGSLEPACDPLEWADADDWNRELTEQWTAQVYRAALRIPTLPIPQQAQGMAALYDVSDDWIPIYDRASLAASTWRSAPAATSSRTRRSPAG